MLRKTNDAGTSELIHGSETILLVEDEDDLRTFTCSLSEQGSYAALFHPIGDHAHFDPEDDGSKQQEHPYDHWDEHDIQNEARAGHLGQRDETAAVNNRVGRGPHWQHVRTVRRKRDRNRHEQWILAEAQRQRRADWQERGCSGGVAGQLSQHQNAEAHRSDVMKGGVPSGEC